MTYHEALVAALALVSDEGAVPDVDAEELAETLADMTLAFEPYAGDNPNGPKRVPHPCRCTNCDLTFVRFWLPADAARVARATLRGNVCPRCYATDGIVMVWGDDSKAKTPPMSFSANIVNAKANRRSMDLILEVRGNEAQIEQAYDAVKSGQLVTVTTMPGSLKP